MTTLIFPLHIERFDDMQGMYGRQIAQLLSDRLADATFSAKRLTWYAHKGDQVAHIAVEAPFPQNVVREEALAHNADTVVLGRVRVAPESTRLQLAVLSGPDLDQPPTEVFDETGAVHALPQMVERASDALVHALLPADDPRHNTHASPQTEAQRVPPEDDTQSAAAAFEHWRDELQHADMLELQRAMANPPAPTSAQSAPLPST